MRKKIRIQFTLLTVVFMSTIPFSVYGTDGQIKIGQTASTTFPIQITQSGSYVLTSNLTVPMNKTGIAIDVDNVTLDLNGHVLVGSGGSVGDGIQVGDLYNIVIMNGTVRGFAEYGIRGHGGRNSQFKDLKVHGNGAVGISASASSIMNCTFNSNGSHGIDAGSCTITNCLAYENDADGINATFSTITNCTSNNNTASGINALYGSTIVNCTAFANGSTGIHGERSTVTNCTSYNNSGIGISGKYSSIKNSTSMLNLSHGFEGSKSTIIGCTASANTGNGFDVGGSTVIHCNANENTLSGISASSWNHIEGNNMRGNNYGLLLEASSSRDYAIKNTASNNSTNFQDNGSNNYMPLTGDNANYW